MGWRLLDHGRRYRQLHYMATLEAVYASAEQALEGPRFLLFSHVLSDHGGRLVACVVLPFAVRGYLR